MLTLSLALLVSGAPSRPDELTPLEPVPSARQLAWHELELYAFVHFGINTFTDREWGEGSEDPQLFDPTALDCEQWVDAFARAGMQGVIITAKHHDGFCLWPSKLTDHSVASSPWRDGNGDVLAELSAACRERGLEFGVYVSPWDRHEESYGDSPRDDEFFTGQLREVLTSYGDVFEVWFDGANGEGPNGKRQVYDWPRYRGLVRELQPNACMFSDAGPDVRWVGNERGFANETNWSLLRRAEFYPGSPNYRELTSGHEDGTHWVPAEADVSIRPGWFYHAAQADAVKSPEELVEVYYRSVGRNASLLLNVPPTPEGLIHENDVASMLGMRAILDATFEDNLASAAQASAPASVAQHGPELVLDGRRDTYWVAQQGSARLELEWDEPRTFDRLVFSEALPLGQRVRAWLVHVRDEAGAWRQLATASTIGAKRILRFEPQTTTALRFDFVELRAAAAISEVGVFLSPAKVTIEPPGGPFTGTRAVTLASNQADTVVRYTLDGSEPTAGSPVYEGPIQLADSAQLRARAFRSGAASPLIARASFEAWKAADLLTPIMFVRAPDAGARYHYIEQGLQSLVDVDFSQAQKTGVTREIDLEMRERDEHFGIQFSGFFRAPSSGIYQFELTSDDGSELSIGGRTVIDHDGLHGMSAKTGAIGLQAGWHPLRLRYFNAAGAFGLKLSAIGPEGTLNVGELLHH